MILRSSGWPAACQAGRRIGHRLCVVDIRLTFRESIWTVTEGLFHFLDRESTSTPFLVRIRCRSTSVFWMLNDAVIMKKMSSRNVTSTIGVQVHFLVINPAAAAEEVVFLFLVVIAREQFVRT